MQCPCQSGKPYSECCSLYHDGLAAPSAEALMRSRYSAYALHKMVYVYRSWSAQTRPDKQSLKKSPPLQWLGLTVIRTARGTVFDNDGIVEFVARYQQGEQVAELHEVITFVRENGRWVYVKGGH